ncbi:MAG TPA: hypothetical protein VLE94_21250 [Burkholderiaceae bacterium]|nr:hypothetical protein [Burkholderiaceae bacterium]
MSSVASAAAHGRQLVGLVADALVVRDHDPAFLSDNAQPLGVGRVVRKVVGVPLHEQTGLAQPGWKLFAEIAVGEEDVAHVRDGGNVWRLVSPQAARSYSAACSMSAGVRS